MQRHADLDFADSTPPELPGEHLRERVLAAVERCEEKVQDVSLEAGQIRLALDHIRDFGPALTDKWAREARSELEQIKWALFAIAFLLVLLVWCQY